MERSEQIEMITKIIKSSTGDNGDWVDFALIGIKLADYGLNYKSLGYPKLSQYIKSFTDIIEIDEKYVDDKPPVFYARLYKLHEDVNRESESEQGACNVRNTSVANEKSIGTDSLNKASRKKKRRPLFDWAYFPKTYIELLKDLSEIALRERWHFGKSEHGYPIILDKYLHYTFERLKYEGKLECNDSYAAFNTGLVNHQYKSIYLIFNKRPIKNDLSDWIFWDFAVPGEESAGKELVRQFDPLPKRAKYFEKLSDCLYEDDKMPECDYPHILQERVDRLPYEFIEDNCPKNFVPMRMDKMSNDEKEAYIEKLSNELKKEDSKMLRNMTMRFKASVELALKRVEWNYKTAIPMYYPTRKTTSLLLPLSLVDDEKVDVALVAEKTSSGAYLGHTILSLEMAYNNARLITRPDSDWLVTDSVNPVIISKNDDED